MIEVKPHAPFSNVCLQEIVNNRIALASPMGKLDYICLKKEMIIKYKIIRILRFFFSFFLCMLKNHSCTMIETRYSLTFNNMTILYMVSITMTMLLSLLKHGVYNEQVVTCYSF